MSLSLCLFPPVAAHEKKVDPGPIRCCTGEVPFDNRKKNGVVHAKKSCCNLLVPLCILRLAKVPRNVSIFCEMMC